MVRFSNTTPLPSRIFWGGYEHFVFDLPPLSMKFFIGGGGLFFTNIYKPNINTYNHKLLMGKVFKHYSITFKNICGGYEFF